jgi:Uncharacterized conserved protein (DUF2190)
MSYDESLKSITLNADASLAVYTGVPGLPGSPSPNYGLQYRFVKVTGAHTCGLCDDPTDDAMGVMQSKPQVTGQAATVAIFGVSNVMAGAAITAGALVTSDSTGRAVTTTTAADVMGIALGDASGANVLVPVLLKV